MNKNNNSSPDVSDRNDDDDAEIYFYADPSRDARAEVHPTSPYIDINPDILNTGYYGDEGNITEHSTPQHFSALYQNIENGHLVAESSDNDDPYYLDFEPDGTI